MPVLKNETSIFPDNLFEILPVTDPEGRRWWAVLTKARNEKALARDLCRIAIPFYLPLIPKRHVYRKRIVVSQIPLFCGYLFLFGDRNERALSLTTNRVSTIIGVDDQTLLRGDLTRIQQLVLSGSPLTIEERLQPGQPIRVKSGALSGVEGVVTHRRGQRRLLVAVHFLNKGVSLELDDCMVEPI